MHKAPPSMATSTLSSILDEYDELEATGNTQPSFSTDDASSSPTTALEQRRSITDELQDAKYDEAWHSRTSRKSKRESVCCRKKRNACAFESGKLHEAKRTGMGRKMGAAGLGVRWMCLCSTLSNIKGSGRLVYPAPVV